ncbi:hypothetical protein BIW11_06855 [Tropilaelaps mercedesae]|uniref:Uncharacterized protein n=1 Tax=Tropilaelaps mercedesae TaxID=418985 RepID=A0A1V9XWA9_9ACAR|nr:hypothetical protein BIW11_06855 [Tropilaelaps mercedesae]
MPSYKLALSIFLVAFVFTLVAEAEENSSGYSAVNNLSTRFQEFIRPFVEALNEMLRNRN